MLNRYQSENILFRHTNSDQAIKSKLTSKGCPTTSFNLLPLCLISVITMIFLVNSGLKHIKLVDFTKKPIQWGHYSFKEKQSFYLIMWKTEVVLLKHRKWKEHQRITFIVNQHMKIVILSISIGPFQSNFSQMKNNKYPNLTLNLVFQETSLIVVRQW